MCELVWIIAVKNMATVKYFTFAIFKPIAAIISVNLTIIFICCPPLTYLLPSNSFSKVVFLFFLFIFPSPFACRVLVTIFTGDRNITTTANGRLPKDIKCKFSRSLHTDKQTVLYSFTLQPFQPQKNDVKASNWKCSQVRCKKQRCAIRSLINCGEVLFIRWTMQWSWRDWKTRVLRSTDLRSASKTVMAWIQASWLWWSNAGLRNPRTDLRFTKSPKVSRSSTKES